MIQHNDPNAERENDPDLINTSHTPLSREELLEFRNMLEEKRRELAGDERALAEELGQVDEPKADNTLADVSTHQADDASRSEQYSRGLKEFQTERDLLLEVDAALGRIETGTYGVCEGTGQPISKDRLQAKPWARYSIEYARKMEQRGGRR